MVTAWTFIWLLVLLGIVLAGFLVHEWDQDRRIKALEEKLKEKK